MTVLMLNEKTLAPPCPAQHAGLLAQGIGLVARHQRRGRPRVADAQLREEGSPSPVLEIEVLLALELAPQRALPDADRRRPWP